MVPGFGFDVEPSVFVKMIYTRSGDLCAAENKISFDIASVLFLPTQMGWAVSDAFDFLFIQVLYFSTSHGQTLCFPLFCYVS